MEIVMLLVPIMLVLVTMGILLFSWAVKNGQYDDLEGPAHRILYDDDNDLIPEEARIVTSEPADTQANKQDNSEDTPGRS